MQSIVEQLIKLTEAGKLTWKNQGTHPFDFYSDGEVKVNLLGGGVLHTEQGDIQLGPVDHTLLVGRIKKHLSAVKMAEQAKIKEEFQRKLNEKNNQ